MKRDRTQLIALVILMSLCFLAASVAFADGKTTLVGRRYECMYEIVNGQLELITNPEERPYVEFLSNQKCAYLDGGDNCTYMLGGSNNIMVIESGIFPMLSFEAMSNGRLRIDGLGMMYSSFEDFDEWYYNTNSEEYKQLALQAEEIRKLEAEKSSMSSLKRITTLYPFRNGYACAADEDSNYHYIDTTGKVVFSVEDHWIPASRWPMYDGVTIVHADKSTYQMVKAGGEVIREFTTNDYTHIGAPSEGYVCTVKKDVTLAGTSHSVVYYDLTGHECLSFSDLTMLEDGLSNFSSGRAFLKRENGEGREDDEYVLIDTAGNARTLSIANREEAVAVIYKHYQEETYNPKKDAVIGLNKITIEEISCFEPGERYAAARVEIEYSATYKETYGTRTSSWDIDYLAAIDRNGKVHLLCNAYKNSPCFNESILIQSDSSASGYDAIYLIDDMKVLYAKEIPALSQGSGHRLYFMEDGTYLVAMNESFWAVINQNGEVLMDPVRSESFSPQHNGRTRYSQEDYYASDCKMGTVANKQVKPIVISADLLYQGVGKNVSSFSPDTPYLTYYDINGAKVGSDLYMMGTPFVNGYALVAGAAQKSKISSYTMYAGDLCFINKQGERVDQIDFGTPIPIKKDQIRNEHSMSKTREVVKDILSTDQSYRSAFNAALPNTVGGEVYGYLYDVWTFDLFGLIKHIADDTTKNYQKDAAKAIEKALLSGYDVQEVSKLYGEINEVLKSDDIRMAKDFKTVSKHIVDVTNVGVSYSNYPDAKLEVGSLDAFSKMLKSIDYFSKYIDTLKATEEQKLMIAILVSNYAENLTYVENSIQKARSNGNTEMEAIYTIVHNDLADYYKAFIDRSAAHLAKQGLSFIDWDFLVDTVSTVDGLTGSNLTAKSYVKGLNKSGKITDETFRSASALLVLHAIVVDISKALGTDKTYDAMQALYENAIVLNAMVPEVSEALIKYSGGDVADLKNKALALAEYRLMTLENLRTYHANCFSGEVFLDPDQMLREEIILQECIDYLTEL